MVEAEPLANSQPISLELASAIPAGRTVWGPLAGGLMLLRVIQGLVFFSLKLCIDSHELFHLSKADLVLT